MNEQLKDTPNGVPEKCNCAEITCQEGCTKNHTHKGFWCEKCHPERYTEPSVPKVREEEIPKYRNGSKAIPKNEIVVPYSAVVQALTQRTAEIEKEIERLRKEKPKLIAENLDARLLVSCYNEALEDVLVALRKFNK